MRQSVEQLSKFLQERERGKHRSTDDNDDDDNHDHDHDDTDGDDDYDDSDNDKLYLSYLWDIPDFGSNFLHNENI